MGTRPPSPQIFCLDNKFVSADMENAEVSRRLYGSPDHKRDYGGAFVLAEEAFGQAPLEKRPCCRIPNAPELAQHP